MKTTLRPTLAPAAVLLCALAAGCATPGRFDTGTRRELAASVIADWSEVSRLAAARTIELYGPPDAVARGALGWTRRDRWLRIVVWDSTREDPAEPGRTDNFEQTIAYRVPETKRQALADFDRGVRVSEDGKALSARSSDENLNCLALNLADEIVRGVREPGEARRFYDRTTELSVSGKASPYMLGLLFPPRD